MNQSFRSYVNTFSKTAGIVPAAPPLDPKSFTQRELPPAEVAYELGTFHVSEQDTAGGRALITQAIGLNPKLGGPHEEMGYLLYSEGKDDEARAQWKEAAALDSTLYRARFAYLMTDVPMFKQTVDQQQATLKELRAVLHLNGFFAPAYVEVALLQWQMGNLDGAWRAADEATRMEPWRAGYRMLAGHILLAQGKAAEAAQIARNAAQFAVGTDRDEAVALWMEVPISQRGEGLPLTYDLPPGVKVTHGTLTAFECPSREKSTKFTVSFVPEGLSAPVVLSGAQHMRFGTADTLYRGERRMEPCQHSTGRNVLIAYKPTESGKGELVWLQMLDNLPPVKSAPAGITAGEATGK